MSDADEAATSDHDDDVITTADVDWMNRTMLAQSATTVRRAGMALVVAGVAGLLLALWTSWRYQDQLSDRLDDFAELIEAEVESDGGFLDVGPGFSGGRSVAWSERLDAFAQHFGLFVLPAIAVGLGFGLRLFADYVVVRTGGSLGPVDVGDAVPPPGPDDEDDEDDGGPAPVLPPNPSDFEPRG
jgi:hypothetical protein